MATTGPNEKTLSPRKALLVGFGDGLKNDGGLGQYVVGEFQNTQELFGVEIYSVVLPELDLTIAWPMSEADVAIFVDAREDDGEEMVKVENIAAQQGPLTVEQTSRDIRIGTLLRLVQDWYAAHPACYAVRPKGYDFSEGENISEAARETALEARSEIAQIIRSLAG